MKTKSTIAGLSRREFIYGASAAGLVLGASLRSAGAEGANKGGNFRIGIGHGATTDSLDPATFNDTYMQVVGFGMRNCLTEINNEDKLAPELAESWDGGTDAKKWSFKLRKGVTFHSGKTFSSEDVIASIRHHLGETSKSPVKGLLSTIVEMKEDGPDRVTFVLSEGNADFPYILSDYHIAIMPAKDGVADFRSGDGTGGYKLKHFEPGTVAQLQRDMNYWKAGSANFDTVEALCILDAVARMNAMTSGSVHAIDRVDLKLVDQFKQTPGVDVLETQGALHYSYSMFCDAAPSDNNDVRLAFKYAIDRDAFLKTLLNGHGYVGNDNPIGKSYRYFDASIAQRPYDPDKAKFHLKKAGLDSLAVTFNVSDAAFAGAIDGALLYKDSAAKGLIDITVNREPADAYWSNVWNVKNFTASYWSGRVTEDWMFSTVYAKGQDWNETHWANERFNALLVAARAETNDNKRREMYSEMQRLCTDDCGEIIPAFANYVFATSDTVGHDRLSAAWDLDGIKCLERWWFK